MCVYVCVHVYRVRVRVRVGVNPLLRYPSKFRLRVRVTLTHELREFLPRRVAALGGLYVVHTQGLRVPCSHITG